MIRVSASFVALSNSVLQSAWFCRLTSVNWATCNRALLYLRHSYMRLRSSFSKRRSSLLEPLSAIRASMRLSKFVCLRFELLRSAVSSGGDIDRGSSSSSVSPTVETLSGIAPSGLASGSTRVSGAAVTLDIFKGSTRKCGQVFGRSLDQITNGFSLLSLMRTVRENEETR